MREAHGRWAFPRGPAGADGSVGNVDFAWSDDDLAFEADLVAFLDERLPPFRAEWEGDRDRRPRREPQARGVEDGVMGAMGKRQAWQRVLNEGRWAAILWPEEWGGRDATVSQNVLYTQTMARYRTPGIYNANGIVQIGPAIIQCGSDEQKARWLPSILDASEHWCQCFSEPQAGSDLANLRTTAVRDGDHYVVTGEKVWISSAQIAQWGMCLFRTDPDTIARAQARRHHDVLCRHGDPGHRDHTDPRDHRRLALLLGALRRRPRACGSSARR